MNNPSKQPKDNFQLSDIPEPQLTNPDDFKLADIKDWKDLAKQEAKEELKSIFKFWKNISHALGFTTLGGGLFLAYYIGSILTDIAHYTKKIEKLEKEIVYLKCKEDKHLLYNQNCISKKNVDNFCKQIEVKLEECLKLTS